MSLKKQLTKIKEQWLSLRHRRGYRNVIGYLWFVVVAAIFWLFIALNDNIQENVDVKIRIYNVPDSATFIDIPPSQIHLTVRDKGTQLIRTTWFHTPVLNINFKEFATGGVLRIPPSELYSVLRGSFNSSTQITSASIDSLHLSYTTNPGRSVPVIVRADIQTADGYVLAGKLRVNHAYVKIYSNNTDADTITKVYTNRVVRRNLDASESVKVALEPIPGVRMIPSMITVKIPVEAMVKKKAMVPVTVINVPPNESLLIFPANVEVTYFVPMSKFSSDNSDVAVIADYNEIRSHRTRMPVSVGHHDPGIVNVTLLTDSVEYTIVRQ